MKKAKIMLAAIAVFAVVGGALAFKAKSPQFKICIPNDDPAFCPVAVPLAKISPNVPVIPYYSTANPNLCNQFTLCTTQGKVTAE